jgi:hypothetical protein
MPTFYVWFTFHLIPNFKNCLFLDLCHEVYFLLYDLNLIFLFKFRPCILFYQSLDFLSFIGYNNFWIKIFQLSPSGKTVITSDHALKLESVPEWIAIVGSGYIGLEFSDVYTALGSEVNTSLWYFYFLFPLSFVLEKYLSRVDCYPVKSETYVCDVNHIVLAILFNIFISSRS